MEFKDITLSGLRENRADLIKEIEAAVDLAAKLDAARAEAAAAERERIKGIEENSLPGHEKMTAEFKFDGKTTPAEAAVKILQAEKALGGKHLKAMADDEAKLKGLAPEFKPANDDATDKKPVAKNADGWKAEWASSDKLQAEFTSADLYAAHMKYETRKNGVAA